MDGFNQSGLRLRFRRNPRLADQTLSGKAVILNYEGKRMLGLNPTGTTIWNLLDGRTSLGEIAEALARQTVLATDAVTPDVLEFAADLQKRDLILPVMDDEGPGRTGDLPKDPVHSAHSEEKK